MHARVETVFSLKKKRVETVFSHTSSSKNMKGSSINRMLLAIARTSSWGTYSGYERAGIYAPCFHELHQN